MHPVILLAGLLYVSGGLAASTCAASTSPQYNDIQGGFGYSSGCYPLNYYQTADLGQTNPDDARSRCQQQCASMASCGSTVAQLNKAADSNLYTGSCFFYSPNNVPTSPRSCGDSAYLLQAYKKDDTANCFTSSTSAASSFCSSHLGVTVVTTQRTVTSTPPVITKTNVVSVAASTVTLTSVLTPTVTATATTTVPVTVSTNFITATSTTTSITTATVTVTSSATVTGPNTTNYKKVKRATAQAPACVTSDTPSTRLSTACSCLALTTSTTTVIVTQRLRPVTVFTTSISVVPSSVSQTKTTVTGAPTTVTVTATALSSVTATSTITSVITAVSTTTTTTTTTATTTVACANAKFVPGKSTCTYSQYCQEYFAGNFYYMSPTKQNSEADCFNLCDSYNKPGKVNCYGFSYYFANQTCQMYEYETGKIQGGPNVDSYYFQYCPYTG